MIYVLIGLFLIIIILEVPTLIKEKLYKELVVFTVLFAIGVYMSLVQIYNFPWFDVFDYIITMLPQE